LREVNQGVGKFILTMHENPFKAAESAAR